MQGGRGKEPGGCGYLLLAETSLGSFQGGLQAASIWEPAPGPAMFCSGSAAFRCLLHSLSTHYGDSRHS